MGTLSKNNRGIHRAERSRQGGILTLLLVIMACAACGDDISTAPIPTTAGASGRLCGIIDENSVKTVSGSDSVRVGNIGATPLRTGSRELLILHCQIIGGKKFAMAINVNLLIGERQLKDALDDAGCHNSEHYKNFDSSIGVGCVSDKREPDGGVVIGNYTVGVEYLMYPSGRESIKDVNAFILQIINSLGLKNSRSAPNALIPSGLN